jgi:hypothetical protein
VKADEVESDGDAGAGLHHRKMLTHQVRLKSIKLPHRTDRFSVSLPVLRSCMKVYEFLNFALHKPEKKGGSRNRVIFTTRNQSRIKMIRLRNTEDENDTSFTAYRTKLQHLCQIDVPVVITNLIQYKTESNKFLEK